MKPPHFDEGINGWFVDQMMKNGFYRYDPTNYHGPLHFYILLISQSLFGRHIWALRLPVVLASIGSIFLTLKFEPLVGRRISRIAALRDGDLARVRFLRALLDPRSLAAAFLDAFRARVARALALRDARLPLVRRDRRRRDDPDEGDLHHPHRLRGDRGRRALGFASPDADAGGEAGARSSGTWPISRSWPRPAIFFIVFFYSGTFLNWPGVKGLYETFAVWYQTGSKGNGHEKPWPYWLELTLRYEWPVFIGLMLCLACQFFKSYVIRYLAIYGVGVFAAYSIINYKTPWIIISIVWPLLFVFAAGAVALKIPRKAFYIVGLGLVGFCLGALFSYAIQSGPVREHCSWGTYLRETVTVTLAASSTSATCGEIGWRLFGGARGRAPRRRLGLYLGEKSRLSEGVMRATQRGATGLALLVSLGMAIFLNYFHFATDTEPYVYVQTYSDIDGS